MKIWFQLKRANRLWVYIFALMPMSATRLINARLISIRVVAMTGYIVSIVKSYPVV